MIYKKYLKNDCRLRLYPAANIIGGRMNVKKTSLLKESVCVKFDYFRIYFTSGDNTIARSVIITPIIMHIPDSCM